jgi:hypothetical protein
VPSNGPERLIGHTREGCHRPDRPYEPASTTTQSFASGAIAMLGQKCSDELEPSSQTTPKTTLVSIDPSGF